MRPRIYATEGYLSSSDGEKGWKDGPLQAKRSFRSIAAEPSFVFHRAGGRAKMASKDRGWFVGAKWVPVACRSINVGIRSGAVSLRRCRRMQSGTPPWQTAFQNRTSWNYQHTTRRSPLSFILPSSSLVTGDRDPRRSVHSRTGF